MTQPHLIFRNRTPIDTTSPDLQNCTHDDTTSPDLQNCTPNNTTSPDLQNCTPNDTTSPDIQNCTPNDTTSPDLQNCTHNDTTSPDLQNCTRNNTTSPDLQKHNLQNRHVCSGFFPQNMVIHIECLSTSRVSEKSFLGDERGEAGKNFRGPALRKVARGPTVLQKVFPLSSFPLSADCTN